MRKVKSSFEQTKEEVALLLGKDVTVRYCKGRSKPGVFKARVNEIYSNVFVLTVYNEIFDKLSCSYTDILCGDVSIKARKSD